MGIIEAIIFLFAAFWAGLMATVAGFGSSTVLMPVALFFTDFKTAIFLVGCFHLFNNLFKVQLFYKSIDPKIFLLFGIPSICFAFLGAQIVINFPAEALIMFLGIFLMTFSVIAFLNPQVTVKATKFNAILGGGFSGLLAGLIGLGGAIRAIFLICFNLPKEIYIATSAAIALVIDLTRLATYLWGGLIQQYEYFILLPFLVVTAYLGVNTGKKLLVKIDQKLMRKIVLILILIVGLKLIAGIL